MSISDPHAGSAPQGPRSAASPLALGALEWPQRGRRGAGLRGAALPAAAQRVALASHRRGAAGAARERSGNAPGTGTERERTERGNAPGAGTHRERSREPRLARRPRRGWREAAEKVRNWARSGRGEGGRRRWEELKAEKVMLPRGLRRAARVVGGGAGLRGHRMGWGGGGEEGKGERRHGKEGKEGK